MTDGSPISDWLRAHGATLTAKPSLERYEQIEVRISRPGMPDLVGDSWDLGTAIVEAFKQAES